MASSRRPSLIPRHAERLLGRALNQSRVVAVVGARQVGKTTLARRATEERNGTYLNLEDPGTLESVERDPEAVLASPRPLAIDEFQHGGDELLRVIKGHVDRRRAPGQVLLTGSTRFTTVPMLSESLAGRVAILDLWPLSQGEIRDGMDSFPSALFGPTARLRTLSSSNLSRMDALRMLCAGGYPAVHHLSGPARKRWYDSYVRTITQRDVRTFSRMQDVAALHRLLRLLAARTSQELNVSDVSKDLGIPRTTLTSYIPLLETVFLVYRLPAWSTNLTSRVVKHPKLHFTDAGLAAELLGVGPKALVDPLSRVLGPLLETFVASEISRQITWSRTLVDLYHFRGHNGPEVDLVLDARDGRVAAVEVKASSTIQGKDFRGLDLMAERLGDRFRNGVVLYLGDRVVPFGPRRTAMPLSALWTL